MRSVYPSIDPQTTWHNKSYTGKVVLITGASRGVGPVIATFYARAGAKLALIARSSSNLDSVRERIQQENPDVEILLFAQDVKDTDAAARAVQDIVDHLGRLDVVVANVGVSLPIDGTRGYEAL